MSRPVANNRFSVSIGGLITFSCSKISNISREIQYDVLKEGGVNDYVHVLQKAYTTPHKLIFERGIGSSDMISKLTPLLVGKRLPFPGIITVKDSGGSMVNSYSFDNPIILKWELGELDAIQNKVLIEKLVVGHNGISASLLGAITGMIF